MDDDQFVKNVKAVIASHFPNATDDNLRSISTCISILHQTYMRHTIKRICDALINVE